MALTWTHVLSSNFSFLHWLQVAAWLLGNALPLSSAVVQLWQQVSQSTTSQTQDSLRNCILDLATRKPYGIKGSKL